MPQGSFEKIIIQHGTVVDSIKFQTKCSKGQTGLFKHSHMPDGSPDVYVHPMMRSSHLMPNSLNLHPTSWVNSSDSVTDGQWVLVVANGIMSRSSPHFPITAQRVNVPTEATTMRHGGVGATIR